MVGLLLPLSHDQKGSLLYFLDFFLGHGQFQSVTTGSLAAGSVLFPNNVLWK